MANHLRTTDNRDLHEMERVYLARIEALTRALAEANKQNDNLTTMVSNLSQKVSKLLNKHR